MKINHNLTSGVLYAFDHLPPSPRRLVRPISLSSIELSIIQAGSWIGSDWKVLAANKWSNLDILINPVQTLPLPGRLCDCEAQGKGKGVPIISSSFLHGKLRENCTEIPIKVTCFNLISFELSVQGKRGGKLDMIFNTYVREFKEISRQIYLEIEIRNSPTEKITRTVILLLSRSRMGCHLKTSSKGSYYLAHNGHTFHWVVDFVLCI